MCVHAEKEKELNEVERNHRRAELESLWNRLIMPTKKRVGEEEKVCDEGATAA